MKAERLEDLGALKVIIDNILDNDFFNLYKGGRNKDCLEWFEDLKHEEKESFIHSVVYGISEIETLLRDCLAIARGDIDEDGVL